MKRRELAVRGASGPAPEKPIIFCGTHGYFYVRLPGHPHVVQAWNTGARIWLPYPFTYAEALRRVARYYGGYR